MLDLSTTELGPALVSSLPHAHPADCPCDFCVKPDKELTVWIGGVESEADLEWLIREYVDKRFRGSGHPENPADIVSKRYWADVGYGCFVIRTSYYYGQWLADTVFDHEWTFGLPFRGPLAARDGDLLSKKRGKFGISPSTLHSAEISRLRQLQKHGNRTTEHFIWYRRTADGPWSIGIADRWDHSQILELRPGQRVTVAERGVDAEYPIK